MFTGIVQVLGKFVRLEGLKFQVEGALAKVRPGDSVAVNGVCLTVVKSSGPARRRRLSFNLSRETLDRTSLGGWKPGRKVNLEPALRAGDSLGGHFVQGHVDGVGRLESRRAEKGWTLFTFSAPAELSRYLVHKGSVAIDGVSLTALAPQGERFGVAVIPQTERSTTLGTAQTGDAVNIEADMMAKHVEKLISAWRPL